MNPCVKVVVGLDTFERETAMAAITQEKMKTFKASVRGALIIAQLQS